MVGCWVRSALFLFSLVETPVSLDLFLSSPTWPGHGSIVHLLRFEAVHRTPNSSRLQVLRLNLRVKRALLSLNQFLRNLPMRF